MAGFKVGDTVRFGRPNGEKTLGKVVKVNRKSLKVEILESRGSRSQAGQVWRVGPSLCVKVDGSEVSEVSGMPGGPFRSQDDNLVSKALGKLTSQEIKALEKYFRRGYIATSSF